MKPRSRLLEGLLLLLSLAFVSHALAETYPHRPIRLIVPFPPGGSADLVARLVSERASVALGQTIVIDNRAGAGGNVGTVVGARAAPDGYTLTLCTIGTCAINRAMVPDLPYDPERDFTPVVLLGGIPNILTVHPSVPARSVRELVDGARARPGLWTYGSSGIGSSNHLSGELLKSMAGIDLLHVPYKGSGAAITELLGGQIQVFFDNAASILPHVQSGAVRALAVTGTRRAAALPEVPTMEESGYAGFVVMPWFAILAPAKTPDIIVGRLNAAYNAALAEPALRKRLQEVEVSIDGGPPDRLAKHIRSETDRWTRLVNARRLKGVTP